MTSRDSLISPQGKLDKLDPLGPLRDPHEPGCDVFLTEIKAAGIDTVATRARELGARVVFLRNRPVARDGSDLDATLLAVYDEIADG